MFLVMLSMVVRHSSSAPRTDANFLRYSRTAKVNTHIIKNLIFIFYKKTYS